MADIAELTLKVRVAWWVRPYIWIVCRLAVPIAIFANDAQIAAFVDAQSSFLLRHGIRIGA